MIREVANITAVWIREGLSPDSSDINDTRRRSDLKKNQRDVLVPKEWNG